MIDKTEHFQRKSNEPQRISIKTQESQRSKSLVLSDPLERNRQTNTKQTTKKNKQASKQSKGFVYQSLLSKSEASKNHYFYL